MIKFKASERFEIKSRGFCYIVQIPEDFVDDGNIFNQTIELDYNNLLYTAVVKGIERPATSNHKFYGGEYTSLLLNNLELIE